MFQGMLDRFATEAPIPVLARLILGRTVSAEVLDRIFDDHSEHQYTRNLLFSSVFQLMCLVVFRVRPSLRAAYERHRSQIEVSLTSVYNKVNGIDLSTSQALVRETAKRMGAEIEALNGACQPWLEGYRIKVLDGNCIEATHHRIKALRTEGGMQWMGFRPSLPDSLPAIGRSRMSPHVVYAFGHGHLGLTQSAGTARIVADLLTDAKPPIDLTPFSPQRF